MVEDAFGVEDKVVLRWSATMTHRGDHLGMPATGKPVRNHGNNHCSHCRPTNHRGMGQLGPVSNAEADRSLRESRSQLVEECIVVNKDQWLSFDGRCLGSSLRGWPKLRVGGTQPNVANKFQTLPPSHRMGVPPFFVGVPIFYRKNLFWVLEHELGRGEKPIALLATA